MREVTRGAHAELDGLSPLGHDRPTREAYALHLSALAELVCFTEAHVYATDEWKRAVPDHARRAKAHRIRRDLEALGVPVEASLGSQPPSPVRLGSFGYGMGVAYVVEGSTLGGVVLARRLRESLGDAVPSFYMTAYGDDVGPMWSAFCASLEACPRRAARGAMGDGARDAFAAVKRRFIALGARGQISGDDGVTR